jgi:nucleoside-diphosphate-sugar epimerase
MARALIVGCGCRGRALGEALLAADWQVRGSTRSEAAASAIERVGIEAAIADPDSLATILDQLDGVTLIYWLMGSASGERDAIQALHSSRLETLFAKFVDTPVRGFVYEGGGSVDRGLLREGARLAREAHERWRIPVEITSSPPAEWDRWLEEMVAAAERLLQR